MSVYLINSFRTKDSKTLRESLSIDRIAYLPQVLQGSVSCVDFTIDAQRRIPMCLKDRETADKVIQAFDDLMKCRSGDSLKKHNAIDISNILKNSCLGLDIKLDLAKFENDKSRAQEMVDDGVNMALRNATERLRNEFRNPSTPVPATATPAQAPATTPAAPVTPAPTPAPK
jgi:hypothetical protein